jgi:hypothetical protein
MQMQLSNLKNIVDDMDNGSPRGRQSAATTMSNVLTPKNKMSLYLDLPNESAASNDHAST